MNIQGLGAIFQSYSVTSPSSSKQPARSSDAANLPGATSHADAAVRTLDYSNMTKNDMQAAAQNLYQAGEIDQKQMEMLQMASPLGKCGSNGEFVPFTPAEREQIGNMPTNYIKLARGAIQGIESRGAASDPKSGYADWKNILSVLQEPHGALPGVNVTA